MYGHIRCIYTALANPKHIRNWNLTNYSLNHLATIQQRMSEKKDITNYSCPYSNVHLEKGMEEHSNPTAVRSELELEASMGGR